MPDKTKTTVSVSKVNSSAQNAGKIQKDRQKNASNPKDLKKDADRVAKNFEAEEKKPKLGRKGCPKGMSWDAELERCV